MKKQYPLVPLTRDSFALQGLGTYRLQIAFDEMRRAVKVIAVHAGGGESRRR